MCDITDLYVLKEWSICVAVFVVQLPLLVSSFHVCDISHSHAWHDKFICVTRLIHKCGVPLPTLHLGVCDLSRFYLWHASFLCETWLIHTCDMALRAWHDSFICVTRLIYTCDMPLPALSIDVCDVTRSYVWHASFVCVTWLVHMCGMAHSYVRHASSICATRLLHVCDMTHPYVRHDSYICATWLSHMCNMNHSYVSRDSFNPDDFRASAEFPTRAVSAITPDPCLCLFISVYTPLSRYIHDTLGWVMLHTYSWVVPRMSMSRHTYE